MLAPLNIGIALYEQKFSSHWALVVHPNNYNAPDVTLYQIKRKGISDLWSPEHRESCKLSNAKNLIGVIHLGQISNFSLQELDICIAYVPTNEKDNQSWGCATWVLRIVTGLVQENVLILPCSLNKVLEFITKKIGVLKATRESSPQGSVLVVPLKA